MVSAKFRKRPASGRGAMLQARGKQDRGTRVEIFLRSGR